MKTIYFSFFFLLIIGQSTKGQSCLPTGIVFTTQQEIDDFPTNYPGCVDIEGNVEIDAITPGAITNLNGLSQLTNLGGGLRIKAKLLGSLSGLHNIETIEGPLNIEDTQITNLSGLHNLTYIGDSIKIYDCSYLTTLDGLQGLDSIFHNLEVIYSNSFKSFEGLDNLQFIKGNLIINKNYELDSLAGLNNLKYIGGSLLIIENSNLNDIQALENLERIGKSLELFDNFSLNSLSGLDALSSIGENLRIVKCGPYLTNLSGLDSLIQIGGDLSIGGNYGLLNLSGLDQLESVGGNLGIGGNEALQDISGLESLTFVGQNFFVSESGNLTDVSGLNNLTTVQKSVRFWEVYTIDSISGLNSLTHIGQDFILFSCHNLSSITGFNNLTTINGKFLLQELNSLSSIIGLRKLTSIQGDLSFLAFNQLVDFTGLENLHTIGNNFFVNGSDSITSFSGLSNLNSIGGILGIAYLENLVSLSGLEQLTTVKNFISINHNPLLTDIKGIRNINPNHFQEFPDTEYQLEIFLNLNLSDCGVKSVCEIINLPNPNVYISNNGQGCSSVEEIECIDFGISGYVYYDYNQNQQFDSNEGGMSNFHVAFTPGEQVSVTNSDGRFYQLCEEGETYTFGPVFNNSWSLTTPEPTYSLLFNAGNSDNYNNNFGFYPNFTKHGGRINLTSFPTRCNTEVDFFIRYQNEGTFNESGQVSLSYDLSSQFISAAPAPDEIDLDNHLLIWNYSDLLPFQYNDITLTLSMPDETQTNEELNFITTLYHDDVGSIEELHSFQYSPIVLCSYDPNDKLVMPPGVHDENYTLHDKKLTYTIRFQNTGNAEAIDIRILDTLDTDLDLSTFRVLNSSFPVQTSLDGYNVEFFFNNIWLPDSTSNEPASHGFVTYEISPIEELEDYTEITNTAHIIFDFNPPIVTNTTLNTMVEMIPTGIEELEESIISIHPNPASSLVTITAERGRIDQVQIFNQLGQEVLRTDKTTIDISYLTRGFYVLSVRVDEQVIVGKLIVE